MTNTAARNQVFAALEAQRYQAAQAAREQPNAAYLANILERAAKLAQGGYLKESAAMARRFVEETR